MMRKIFLYVTALVSMGLTVENALIKGTVYEDNPHEGEELIPLDSVRVCCYIKGATDSTIVWSDSLGNYTIPIDELAPRTVILSREKYLATSIAGIAVGQDKTTYLGNITLKRKPVSNSKKHKKSR